MTDAITIAIMGKSENLQHSHGWLMPNDQAKRRFCSGSSY
jgi:hypothetical protein